MAFNPALTVLADDTLLGAPTIKLSPSSSEPEVNQPVPLNSKEIEDEYRLGPGDVITIMDPSSSLDGLPYVNSTTVAPDGTVSIYPIGLLSASGKTLRQLTEEVNKKCEPILRKPNLVLVLSQTRPVEVYVLGDVLNPGLYRSNDQPGGSSGSSSSNQSSGSSPPGTGGGNLMMPAGGSTKGSSGSSMAGVVVQNFGPTVSNPAPGPSTLTALTALQLAGGVRETADIRHIKIRRATSKKTTEFNLEELLLNGEIAQDVVLRPGDTIMVPKGGENFAAELFGNAASQRRLARIFGSVKSPGVYQLMPNDDVLSLIARAGGFSDDAYTWRVTLSRTDRNGRFIAKKISMKKSIKDKNYIGRVPLMSGDVVQVHANYIKKAAPRTLTICGALTSAFIILFLSRRIVDQSNPSSSSSSSSSGSLNSNNAGPLGLPSVF